MVWRTLVFIALVGLLAAFAVRYIQAPSFPSATITTVTTDNMQATGKLYPALFICHGGGPLPLLDDPSHRPMVEQWKRHVKDIVGRFGKPSVIAVVSAHYNTHVPEVGSDPSPAMYYDYGGFPPESYKLQYPAPGDPALAAEMVAALGKAGMLAKLNPKRRYDHGVFVPLMIMFADAKIPVIPISVLRSDDPAEHIRMGEALRPFRKRGVFFLGSGSSMHHFGNLMQPGAGSRFGDALTAVLQSDLTAEERLGAMQKVEKMEGFDEAQPHGAHEHLMPLLTLVGTAAGTAATEVASVRLMEGDARHYLFEN